LRGVELEIRWILQADGATRTQRREHVTKKRVERRRNELADAHAGTELQCVDFPCDEVVDRLEPADDPFRLPGRSGGEVYVAGVVGSARDVRARRASIFPTGDQHLRVRMA